MLLNSILLQTDSLLLSQESIVSTEASDISVFQLFLQGGLAGQIIIMILFCLSIITVYLFIERLVSIKKALKEDDYFFHSIKDFLHDGKYSSAIDLCQNTDTPIARMLEKGIIRIEKSLEDISTSINNVGKLELSKLENNLAILGTISGVAPMIGFLGTVIGMVLAFYEMASAGGQIDIEMLSKGIYTAMTTTVAGLIVGIIAYISYNYLVSKITKAVHKMETMSIEFLDLIYDKKNN
ncbi:MAG: biopolymer transporter ExbB [Flavobacteriales bacterium]|jgi:biopolymer transport protein ExbB|nr:biopolymer transporter ExbB [Flavobacteriales bacterium]|tara:strand:- start:964 stop:1677 length:714 start_codon:yes stop_codon:yes gene_type:complete